jgi:hypothetical protein
LSPNKSNGTSQADIAKHFTYDKSKASKVTSEKKLPANIQQRADEFITDDLRAGIGKTEVQFTREKKMLHVQQ